MFASPISDEGLEAAADAIARLLRVIGKRAPRELRREARELLARVHRTVQDIDAATVASRLALAKELELFDARLHGRTIFTAQFYAGNRLATVRYYAPIRIRGALDHRWLRAFGVRWLARADRAHARLSWFLERCGIDSGAGDGDGEVPFWQQPYGHFEEPGEFLWGRVTRG